MGLSSSNSLLLLLGSSPWSPLSQPSLRFHVDLSQRTLVSGGVDSWTDQGPTATHATTATLGAGYRPPLLADAGDGLEAVDFRSGGEGKVLVAPFSAADLKFLHDGETPWTIGANLLVDAGETIEQVPVATGSYTTAHAGILMLATPAAGGFQLSIWYSDGTTAVAVFSHNIFTPPERAYYWATFDPAGSPKALLYRNGVEVDAWDGEVPALAGDGQGFGLVLGQYAHTNRFRCSTRGRTLSIYAGEAIRDERTVGNAADWAYNQGYV